MTLWRSASAHNFYIGLEATKHARIFGYTKCVSVQLAPLPAEKSKPCVQRAWMMPLFDRVSKFFETHTIKIWIPNCLAARKQLRLYTHGMLFPTCYVKNASISLGGTQSGDTPPAANLERRPARSPTMKTKNRLYIGCLSRACFSGKMLL